MTELANIEGDEIVIRVPISAIRHAASAALEECGVEVTDEREAAKAIVRYLNDEDEEGSTPVHFALDKALTNAVEQGEEGFSFDEDAGLLDAETQIGAAICWLRLLATRFSDEWPQTASAARSHADNLEKILSRPEAASKIEAQQAEIARLEALISAENIEHLATDIAIACVDCRPEIREARHKAMVRLGERLRKPLSLDLNRLQAALNHMQGSKEKTNEDV